MVTILFSNLRNLAEMSQYYDDYQKSYKIIYINLDEIEMDYFC